MNKPIRWLRVVIGCAGVAVAGCESLQKRGHEHTTRSTAPPIQAEAEPDAPSGPKGFFKNSRLPGALSSEGAEIEKSLGVQ
jgi:hypothetical protein